MEIGLQALNTSESERNKNLTNYKTHLDLDRKRPIRKEVNDKCNVGEPIITRDTVS